MKANFDPPKRGFARLEYQQRIERAQGMMRTHKLDALFFTTQEAFAYFTGFQTQFWLSPTRPWYLLIPQAGQACAIIPSIGQALMERKGMAEIYTWSAPDLEDDGIGLLCTVIKEKLGREAARIDRKSVV